MKYLRWFVCFIVRAVFIMPMNVIVTVSTDEDQYRDFKTNTHDRILSRLKNWARGEQPAGYCNTRTLVA